ncbi:MAG: PEP-CTERM sorting domain-containing protein [Gammaproteobacteria bacterium]
MKLLHTNILGTKQLASLSVVLTATLSSAPALAAHADVSAQVSGFKIELIDLDPNDGIAPSIVFDNETFPGSTYTSEGSGSFTGYDSVFTPVGHGGASASLSTTGMGTRAYFSESAPYGGWQTSKATRGAAFTLSASTGLLLTAQATLRRDRAPSVDAYSSVILTLSVDDHLPGIDGRQYQSQEFAAADGERSHKLSAYLSTGAVAQQGYFSLETRASLTDPGLPPTPVPEPETWGMMLVGLGLLDGAAARRRRAA